MKKIFIAVLAVAAMASCATDEIVNAPKGAAIGFDETFVDNAVRANDITSDNIANFSVYGSVVKGGQQGLIFTNQLVEKDGNAYTYSPAQYWIAAANYYFVAIAPYSNVWAYAPADNLAQNGTITFNNGATEVDGIKGANANVDLLYAYQAPATTPGVIEEQPDAVAFTFNHILSRVKFSFVNGFDEGSNIKLEVDNVTVTNAHKSGTLAVTGGVLGTWVASEPDQFVFGAVNAEGKKNVVAAQIADKGGRASTEHFYFIPADATYEVTFTVKLWQAGVHVDTYNHTVNVDANLAMGHSYDIVANLTPGNVSDDPNNAVYPIEFTVTKVEDWAEFGEVTAPGYEVPAPTPGN